MNTNKKKYLYLFSVGVWTLIFALSLIPILTKNQIIDEEKYNTAIKQTSAYSNHISMEDAISIGNEVTNKNISILDISKTLNEMPQIVIVGTTIITDTQTINEFLKKDIDTSNEISFIWTIEDNYSLQALIDINTIDKGFVKALIIKNENFSIDNLPLIDFKFQDFNEDNIVENLQDKIDDFELKSITYYSKSFVAYDNLLSNTQTNLLAITNENEVIDITTVDGKVVKALDSFYEDGKLFNKTSDLKPSNINILDTMTEKEFLTLFNNVKFVSYDNLSNKNHKLITAYTFRDINDKSYIIRFINGNYYETAELPRY